MKLVVYYSSKNLSEQSGRFFEFNVLKNQGIVI